MAVVASEFFFPVGNAALNKVTFKLLNSSCVKRYFTLPNTKSKPTLYTRATMPQIQQPKLKRYIRSQLSSSYILL